MLAITIPYLLLRRILSRLWQLLLKISRYVSVFHYRLYFAVLHEQTLAAFAWDLTKTSTFIALCVAFTVLFNHIPRTEYICYKFLYRFDSYFFDIWSQPIGSLTGLTLTGLAAYMMLYYFYTDEEEEPTALPNHYHHYQQVSLAHLKPLQISSVLMNENVVHISTASSRVSTAESTTTTTTGSSSSTLSPVGDPYNIFAEEAEVWQLNTPVSSESFAYDNHKFPQDTNKFNLHSSFWDRAPVILFGSAWLILNIVQKGKHPVYKTKNIVAWAFHVPVHFAVPLVAVAWLYIWHAPGAARLLITCLGLQNCAVLFTYLVFPNAPPSFIKLFGENRVPSFDMVYSDSQASEDKKFSFILHKALHYAAPHKFASFPSLHSAFACLICFFVCHYSKWSWFKLLSVVNVVGQWWAEVYLDHHWRIDSLAGLVYAIVIWTWVRNYNQSLAKIESKFEQARANRDFVNGSTMGMRLFRATKLQNSFDPKA
ncbi:uncharacterized protein LODBEIA_P02920 [Lodderomyces beijingensis]|uniref:Inositolphosphotransferase Aur1/Ipt1 domain-containing protein n=1 Tax=Lodderomyces beijingensis TaxID=1775926 RepID=A0ABP0ZD25_9ASCO